VVVSLNRVEISGRLPRDPDLKVFEKSGTSLCRFTLAVREAHWTRDKGEHVVTHWISVLAWGDLGDSVADRYHRGDELMVVGQLVQDEVPAGEGKKPEKKTRVRALQVVGIRKGRQGDPGDVDPEAEPPFE
jgi:single stranded DNA-binding protein